MLKRVVEEPAANRKMSLFDPHLGPEVSFTEASLKSGFQIEKWTFAVTIRVSNTHFKRVPISVTFFWMIRYPFFSKNFVADKIR